MKTTILSSATILAVATAAPTAPAAPIPTGTNIVFVNGVEMNLNNPAAASGPCAPGDDVLECAKKISAKWTLPEQAYAPTNATLTYRGTCTYSDGSGQLGCDVHIPYRALFQNCKMIDPPQLTQLSKSGVFDCNVGGGCDFAMQFGYTTTNTTSLGYSIGTQLTATGDIGVVSTSLQVSADFTQNWSGSTSATSSETRTWHLAPNDLCNPTTVQFSTQCDLSMVGNPEISSFHIPNPGNDMIIVGLDPDNRQSGTGQPLHLCSANTAESLNGFNYVNEVEFEGKSEICGAMLNPTGVTVDVGAHSGLGPWAIQGCMFF